MKIDICISGLLNKTTQRLPIKLFVLTTYFCKIFQSHKHGPGLKFVHINCRSIFRKLDQIELLYKECDIICCSETWLNPKIPNEILNINGKRIYRLDREGKNINVKIRGGGVCVYLDNKLSTYCTLHPAFIKCTADFELLCLDIKNSGLKFMTVICLYRPPSGKIKPCIDYLRYIFSHCTGEIWVLGDFNVDLTVYCIRKKAREKPSYVYRELRDLSRFNDDVSSNKLRNSDF